MGQNVASFTDAWIETQKKVFDEMEKRSHLLQMRGLKPTKYYGTELNVMSHLLQMRGLKRIGSTLKKRLHRSHLLQMRGLKRLILNLIILVISRIFYRCVD